MFEFLNPKLDPGVEEMTKLKPLWKRITNGLDSLDEEFENCQGFKLVQKITGQVFREAGLDLDSAETEETWQLAFTRVRSRLELIWSSAQEYLEIRSVVLLLVIREHARLMMLYCEKCGSAGDGSPSTCWAKEVLNALTGNSDEEVSGDE